MRFIGNKTNLLQKIKDELALRNISWVSFFDFFSGTTSVGKFFKKMGYQIYSSDLMYFSYVLQRAYIQNNKNLFFWPLIEYFERKKINYSGWPLDKVISFLNNLKGEEGFIYKNYTPGGTFLLDSPRMFFTDENGKKIDAIRIMIERWKNKKMISEDEYYVLLACLIESVPFYANISGVYAAFNKKWDPRALKKMFLKPIDILINKKKNFSFNQDSTSLLQEVNVDILYLDPPYNQRQYAPNYHLLETIAKYDDPSIKGVTGLRDYRNQKSRFCNSKTALEELNKIAKFGKYKTLILSYNTEGIMPWDLIMKTLSLYGSVELVEFDYLRFKSNNRWEKVEKFIKEQLFILKKYE